MTFSILSRTRISKVTSHRNTLDFHPLLEQAPELYDDIEFPDYCFTETSDEPEVNAWIGPVGTVSSMHTDNKFNLFSQIRGKKYLVFADQKFSSLIPPVNKVMFNSSKLEVEDQEVWENSGIDFEDCVVEEGDLLYIPKLYWHYVRSLTPSISLSIWFE
ncbi:unnamed protein product [Oikopleura dioica]|uniref:JmjC domain-containing protein n=1 Tax=Oikopleura dioica TaxID=34765 RepID=E4WZJ9_OIKDI|nr:unnamed protein product [Oikopleura dioica]CBY38826.1 unnamed protein product [Oikopleura dioica]